MKYTNAFIQPEYSGSRNYITFMHAEKYFFLPLPATITIDIIKSKAVFPQNTGLEDATHWFYTKNIVRGLFSYYAIAHYYYIAVMITSHHTLEGRPDTDFMYDLSSIIISRFLPSSFTPPLW